MDRVEMTVKRRQRAAVLAFGVAMLSAASAARAATCTGLPAFTSCVAYANGASVTYSGSKYTTLAAIPNNRDCPPISPYNPSTDNWWTDNGACSGSATATATPTTASQPTPTAPPSNTVLFHNTGTTAGWDTFTHEHSGTVTQVTSPVFKGSTAIKVTQIYDSSYTGRYHSEAVRNDGYTPGDQRFYGFAFYLPANWQFVNQSFNIAQFIADFTNTGCDDWMPSTMVWLQGSTLNTRVKYGTICGQHITTYNSIASVTAGAWHRVEIQASWKSDASGYLKLWFDGTKVLEKLNTATTIADPANRTFSFRVGMYANGWHDDGTMIGTQGMRTLYVDQVGIGKAFADADPNGW
jgi:Polysaccharide lyase